MPARLVALDEGCDIPLDRAMVVVGRHPQCDARLDSLRVSRHHCCMTLDHGEVVVRDLGSTNGIRINGHRVEIGRLRANDELSIAHIRYRLENGLGHEATVADPIGLGLGGLHARASLREPALASVGTPSPLNQALGSGVPDAGLEPAGVVGGFPGENWLAALVREKLPSNVADRCRIQVIIQVPSEDAANGRVVSEGLDLCPPDSSR